MDAMTEMERALGTEAVRSLAQRHLLWDVAGPAVPAADDGVRLDRTIGVAIGLAAGNADGDHRVGVETQTFVLSAEAWLDHGWRAPEVLAEQLSRELHTLRTRGEAIGTAVEGYRNGVPWYLAAPTSFGNAALGASRSGRRGVRWRSVICGARRLGRRCRHPRRAPRHRGISGARGDRRRADRPRSRPRRHSTCAAASSPTSR